MSQYDRGDVYETNTQTDLKPGMFTARPVRTAAGQIILDEGCLLSAQTILHIRDYSIPEVWIGDSSDSSGGLHDYLQKQYAPVRSRSERIRQSEEYKIFSQKFDSCTTMLHTALNDCILRAKKLETDKLLCRDPGFVCVAYYHTFHVRHAP